MQIGIAADHGGCELKEQLLVRLVEAGYAVEDFGARQMNREDDYPDYVVPLARAVSSDRVAANIGMPELIRDIHIGVFPDLSLIHI